MSLAAMESREAERESDYSDSEAESNSENDSDSEYDSDSESFSTQSTSSSDSPNASQNSQNTKSSCSQISEASSGAQSEKIGQERIALMEQTFDESSGSVAKGVRGYATIKDLPNNTSKWLSNEEMKTHVFRVFKTRRLKVPVERIPWPYHVTSMDVDIWLMGQDHVMKEDLLLFQDYFRDSLAPIDINPIDWFYGHKGNEKMNLEKQVQCLMLQVVKDKVTAGTKFGSNYFIARMENAFDCWVAKLGNILMSRPTELNESAYEDIFLAFVELFGLKCWPGDRKKMEIPYEVYSADRQKTVTGIRSKPDLILYRHEYSQGYANAIPLAVVEVKKPKGFFSKKRKKMLGISRKRTLSMEKKEEYEELQSVEEKEIDSELCVKRVKFVDVASATSSVQSPASDQAANTQPDNQQTAGTSTMYEEVHFGRLPPCAKIPSQEEKKSWNDFLPQLLGEVVAAGYLQHDATKNSSIGIAVNGYCVTFLNFACQGDFQFQDIPLESGAAMDIFISEPLSILKKDDREKIFKMLLYLAVVPPSK